MMTWKEKLGTKRNIKYEIEVVPNDGKSITYNLPDGRITEDQAASIDNGSKITVLTRGSDSKDVWEMVSEGNTIVDYGASRQRHIDSLAFQAATGPYVVGGGILVLVIGVIRISRRNKREVPTV
jgi:hypothetical protein